MKREKDKILKEFDFVLTSSVKYACQGDLVETFKLKLKAPGNVHATYCNKLTKAFFSSAQSLKKLSEQNNASTVALNSDNSEIDASAIILAITIGHNDIDDVFDAFKDLMCFHTPQHTASVCLLDGKEVMMNNTYDQLSLSDTNRLMGEYIKNFLIPS